MVKFYETEEQLNEDKVSELEHKLSFRFPIEYRNHLLKFNGGRCEPNIFCFEEKGKLTESSVHYFLAIYNGEYDSLEKEFNLLKIEEKRMPSTFFPIANDPLGNCLCMDATDGKVYFWDHENEIDYGQSDDNERSNLYLLANNLNKFISGLK
jgi:hypothetical protein